MTNVDESRMTGIKRRLLKRFRDREYRHAYLDQFLDSLVSAQIRALREERGWNQAELAEKIKSTQSAVSRSESPDYSGWRIDTLRKLAKAFDLALSVKFVSFGDALTDIERFGTDRLLRPGFSEDPVFQENISSTDGSLLIFRADRAKGASRLTAETSSIASDSEPLALNG